MKRALWITAGLAFAFLEIRHESHPGEPLLPLSDAARIYWQTVLALAGIGVVLFQIFLWLKNGSWRGLSAGTVITKWFPASRLAQWFRDPQQWIGLHKVVQMIPLSMWLILASIAMTKTQPSAHP